MTREEFGRAYEDGHPHTVRFLLSRGVNRDTAIDVAQGAWLRGWERLDQLRDESVLVTWVNTIALNQFRKTVRRDQRHEALRDVPYPKPALNWAAIDLSRILSRCRSRDRVLLKAQLVLLCYKRRTPQKGQPGSCRRIWRAMAMRSVAMDAGLCRA